MTDSKIAADDERTFLKYYASRNDGECFWAECPQLRDGEPARSHRHCPLDVDEES